MKTPFHIILIKPSHYDPDGYVIRWQWSSVPSNSLACLYSITEQIKASGELGDDLDLIIDVYDETNQKIPVNKIIRQINSPDRNGIVCMVGVQTNQFPRAVDLSRKFIVKNIPVLIGGFHVSGCLSMLDKMPEDLSSAMTEGITLVAGEVEETWCDILRDAINGSLKPLYNFLDALPGLQGQIPPILPAEVVSRYLGSQVTFDAGRGCPFTCTFCTIINVQGRKSRFRTADDIEEIVRRNFKQGVHRYFVTDDDFARNRNWESILDRIIELREKEGLKVTFGLQVDTASHRLPRFIQKAARAGCRRVFIGLENINPESLQGTGKKQNHVDDYRKMLQAWRKEKVITIAGYITGFPNDTYESVMRDIETLKRELPVDLLELFFLTPLPGSKDHQTLVREGVRLEPDMNKYDLEHPCVKHPKMSDDEWRRTYRSAWRSFYSDEHIETLFRRRRVSGGSMTKLFTQILWFTSSVFIEGVHPLQSGVFRRKSRFERRPGFPIENAIVFHLRRFLDSGWSLVRLFKLTGKLLLMRRKVDKDRHGKTYQDQAIKPIAEKKLAVSISTGIAKTKEALLVHHIL